MQQIYHSNAKTNVNIRLQIQTHSYNSNDDLANQFGISAQTVSKWKNRNFTQDASCRPHHIYYCLPDIQQTLIVSIRKASWLALDEIWEMLLAESDSITRSSVYRCLLRNGINKVPQKEKDKLKKFKEYDPGFLHFDVTYLPKIDGIKYYLFVAIDRATRTLFYHIYTDKSAQSTQDFFDKCMDFFPFKITHILTDNGLEFTNRLLKSKKGELCKKSSLLDIKCDENDIKHRLTKPHTPKTNGMVERANGIIKSNTIAKTEYKDAQQMNVELIKFLIYYNTIRRHGSLRKELKVKTPLQAVEKWFELQPEIFKMKPCDFENEILSLCKDCSTSHQQRCET